MDQLQSRLLPVDFVLPAMPDRMGEELLHIIGGKGGPFVALAQRAEVQIADGWQPLSPRLGKQLTPLAG
ncbi:hypothetical protein [Pseudorhodobacter turbinis]|uniref:hypothetical protein n=1 Tax=Pseudorhodobacter turbinis TaxID=2500533 RepID=UPI00143D6201|nr:hypothetical protein [Pseudorhodobacter turbinis]